ncbi:MAG TPA: endonuclease MutS2, partial [Candidatus Limnocylindria bacterium]|nr:endonuclease MutS2 [Candidatus Limnocylindria bacterium]
MTRTSPAADATGSAADAGTLRALEFAAIVEQLAGLTSFAPSRELAEQVLPMADPVHVGLLQDQTDEADRLLSEQAQASIGGARDIRGALERASRGGRLTPAELLEIGETLVATERFAARL